MIKLPTLQLALILLAFFILTAFTATLIQQRVAAQTIFNATTSAAQNDDQEAVDETVTNNIKQLVKETATKVRGVTDGGKKAIIGEVQRITDEALTIRHTDGQQIFPLANALLMKDGNAISVGEIAVDNWVTIMGTVNDKTITPEFIVVSAESLRTDPQVVVLGTITEISRNSVTISPRDGSSERVIAVATTTELQDFQGNEAPWSGFDVDMTILVVGFENEEGTARATTIKSLAPLKLDSENL